jgi:hypothetical protein
VHRLPAVLWVWVHCRSKCCTNSNSSTVVASADSLWLALMRDMSNNHSCELLEAIRGGEACNCAVV